MKVLIVNAHSPSNPTAQLLFHEFETAVRKQFSNILTPSVDIVVCRRSQIDRFVFIPEEYGGRPGCPNHNALTMFDALDFVFIDGDALLPPWAPCLRKVFWLVKMAYETGKCMFGTNCLLQMLAYVSATAGKPVSVVNGCGEGEPLSRLNLRSKLTDTSKPGVKEVSLDYETGNAYSYDVESGCWVPSLNIGLRKHSSDVVFHREFHVLKKYQSSEVSPDPGVAFENVYIKKTCINHWLFEGLPQHFLAPVKHTWDVLATPLYHEEKKLSVLAAVRCSPAVVEYGHCIAVKFLHACRYKASAPLLANFIRQKHNLMLTFGRLEFVGQALFHQRQEEGIPLADILSKRGNGGGGDGGPPAPPYTMDVAPRRASMRGSMSARSIRPNDRSSDHSDENDGPGRKGLLGMESRPSLRSAVVERSTRRVDRATKRMQRIRSASEQERAGGGAAVQVFTQLCAYADAMQSPRMNRPTTARAVPRQARPPARRASSARLLTERNGDGRHVGREAAVQALDTQKSVTIKPRSVSRDHLPVKIVRPASASTRPYTAYRRFEALNRDKPPSRWPDLQMMTEL